MKKDIKEFVFYKFELFEVVSKKGKDITKIKNKNHTIENEREMPINDCFEFSIENRDISDTAYFAFEKIKSSKCKNIDYENLKSEIVRMWVLMMNSKNDTDFRAANLLLSKFKANIHRSLLIISEYNEKGVHFLFPETLNPFYKRMMGEDMRTDLEKFIFLYKSVGIKLTVTNVKHEQILELRADSLNTDIKDNTFITFDDQGKFIGQGLLK
jgi:hypothetical protein